MNITRSDSKRPIIGALEDALVIGLFALFSGLIAAGEPSLNILYGAGTAAALAGTIAYARLRSISLGE